MRPGAKLKKLEREVSTYQEFRKLSNELIAVNARVGPERRKGSPPKWGLRRSR